MLHWDQAYGPPVRALEVGGWFGRLGDRPLPDRGDGI